MFYKVQKKLVRLPFPPAVIPSPPSGTRKNHDLTKMIPQATINAYKHSFFIRTVAVWNNLNRQAVEAQTVDCFRKAAYLTLITP